MLEHRLTTMTASTVQQIERYIVDGLAACKSVQEIAQDIAKIMLTQPAD